MLALFIQKKLHHARRSNHAKLAWIELASLAQNFAQYVVADAACGFYLPSPLACAARLAQHMCKRFTGALACHLHQTQLRKAPRHGLDPVSRKLLLELGENRFLVVIAGHINEIHNDDAAQVAQAQLARNGLRSLQVGLEDGVVEIARTDVATGVHVDGGQRLGLDPR